MRVKRYLLLATVLVGCGAATADTPHDNVIRDGYTCTQDRPIVFPICEGTLTYDPVVVTTAG